MRSPRLTRGYFAAVTAAFLLSIPIGWLALAGAVDDNGYDWLSRLYPVSRETPHSVVIGIDEQTLAATGGMRRIRTTVAEVLERLRDNRPTATAIDLILSDKGDDAEDARLAAGLAGLPNVVLAADILPNADRWEEPIGFFASHAAAVGHVHASADAVSRVLPLEKVAGHRRKWALALEAARLFRGVAITESPEAIELGDVHIPAPRAEARPLFLRYGGVRTIPALDVLRGGAQAAAVRGRAAFIGITALSAAKDRLMTPAGETMSGVEIHATAFETLLDGRYLERVPASLVLLVCLALAVGAALIFGFLSGIYAYLAGAVLIAFAHAIPHLAFGMGYVFPYAAPFAAAWLSAGAAAGWQYFVVRRQLQKSESDKSRYQQAIHFVTHEMRSPLTAIQGSSELIGRYNLNEDKRKQVAGMINSESKRLARMIQTFLDIERLAEGQIEIRKEHFELGELLATCLQRAQPLAARKDISLEQGSIEPAAITGDRELMEYALYNLLTNAVKYSPAGTRVLIEARRDPSSLRIAVHDQGIGMDAQELRNIFRKFYRTRRAEASGEAGTGIGLSLVDQIVSHHGGRMEVTSTPGKGSCFTMVLPRGILLSPASTSAVPPQQG